MANFYNVSITPSIEEIEPSVRENGGFLRSFGYGFATPGEFPKKIGDWQIMLVDTRGMGNYGSIIVVATTPRSLKLQAKATMRLLRKEADAMEAYSSICSADDEAAREFCERGNFSCKVLPLLHSPLFERKGNFLFADDKWAYFAHSHFSYLRVGDGRHRLWIRKKSSTERAVSCLVI